MDQLNIFELTKPKYKITKPIRLIELFAGIGSQAIALRNLGANFEHYKIVEFDKYAIESYNAIHNTDFETLDITKVKASDLEIVDTDNYEYIMTYSFPCQDLSLAGKQKGMKKGTGTRSSLLWDVERLLNECNDSPYLELPQILLMENVTQVTGVKNIKDFHNLQYFLESLGYSNYVKCLNAKDYGIPQNRNRCFMISILGDYYYEFPKPIPLKLRLKDLLEEEVDESYYISSEKIKYMKETSFHQSSFDVVVQQGDICNTLCARDYKDPKCVQVAQLEGKFESVNRVYSSSGLSPTLTTSQGGNREVKILEELQNGGGDYP